MTGLGIFGGDFWSFIVPVNSDLGNIGFGRYRNIYVQLQGRKVFC